MDSASGERALWVIFCGTGQRPEFTCDGTTLCARLSTEGHIRCTSSQA